MIEPIKPIAARIAMTMPAMAPPLIREIAADFLLITGLLLGFEDG